MSRSILRSIQIQSASASREGCRGRSCDHSLAQVGRLERRKLAQTQSATSLHSLVRWSSPSKVTEPRHVPSGNRRRLVAESFPVTARAAAVRASERCWSLTLAFAPGLVPASPGSRHRESDAQRLKPLVGDTWAAGGAVGPSGWGRSGARGGGQSFAPICG